MLFADACTSRTIVRYLAFIALPNLCATSSSLRSSQRRMVRIGNDAFRTHNNKASTDDRAQHNLPAAAFGRRSFAPLRFPYCQCAVSVQTFVRSQDVVTVVAVVVVIVTATDDNNGLLLCAHDFVFNECSHFRRACVRKRNDACVRRIRSNVRSFAATRFESVYGCTRIRGELYAPTCIANAERKREWAEIVCARHVDVLVNYIIEILLRMNARAAQNVADALCGVGDGFVDVNILDWEWR